MGEMHNAPRSDDAAEPSEPTPSAPQPALVSLAASPPPGVAQAPVTPAAAEADARVRLRIPIDVRTASIVFLALLAAVFALQWAAAVCIPLMLSLMFTYALAPAVNMLQRWHLPRWLGAGVILLGLGGAVGWTGYSLSDSASDLIDALPTAAQKLRQAVRSPSQQPSRLDSVQQAATQLEQAAQASRPALTQRGVTRVVVEKPAFNIRDHLVSGTLGLMTAAGQLVLIAFLTYFALCAGDTFRRKLLRLAGADPGRQQAIVTMLDDITRQIERYLLVQILTSAVVGVATGLVFWALGLNNAAVWGIVAGVTNLIPYVGSLIVMVGASLVAFLQFGTLQMAVLVGGASLLVHTVVGNLLAPWLTSRAAHMNPVAVFVAIIFWGWLWGVWGLLLGLPMLMIFKAVCERVRELRVINELLSG